MRRAIHRLRRLWADRSGASALEFGLLLPVFVPVMFGIVQLGQVFWTQTALQHAVEMAARCATINSTTCGTAKLTQTFAGTQAYGLTFPDGTFVATTAACGNQVSATYSFPVTVAAWFAPSINLSAKSCYPL